ncbi:MAG: hypothetical protein ACOY0T_17315 [Myxococcota bacterium]
MADALRLLVFDATQVGRKPLGLGLSWRVGSLFYRAVGHIDAAYGARDWMGALDWLAQYEPNRPITQIQYWGHGKWGRALIDRESFEAPRRAFSSHPSAPNTITCFDTVIPASSKPQRTLSRVRSPT